MKWTHRFYSSIEKILSFAYLIFLFIILLKLFYFNASTGGHFSWELLASLIGSVLVLTGLTFLLPSFTGILALYIINALLTLLLVSDLLFYRYFNDVLSIGVLAHAGVVGSVQSSIFSLVHYSDILFIFDLVVLIILMPWLIKYEKKKRRAYRFNLLYFIVFIITGAILSTAGVKMLLNDQPGILTSFYDRIYIVQKIGPVNYHCIDIYKFFNENGKNSALTDEDKQALKQYVLDKKKETVSSKLFGAGAGKNLIVIQVEALQEFVINAKINNQEITPNLNKLLKKSMYFNNYYCETAGGGTSDAEFLSNVSLYPVKQGAVYIRYSGNEYTSLAKTMKTQGYSTIAMHAYKAGFWNRSVMYKSLGFDEFFSKNNMEQDQIIGMGLSDKSFFRQSLAKLKSYRQPYYAFMITLSSHYPYDGNKQYYGTLNVGEYKNTFFGNYLEAIHYADEALGEYIDALEKEGMLDNTVLAIYGDHYAIPKDKKADLAKFLNVKMNDFNWVKYQKVPMLIHLPGGQNAGIHKIVGGGIDFMPTILNIMGVKSDAIPMLGRDLLNSKEGLAVMRNGYFKTDKYLSLTADDIAFDADTGQRYDISILKRQKTEMEQNLYFSDMIIEHNLLGELKTYLESQIKTPDASKK